MVEGDVPRQARQLILRAAKPHGAIFVAALPEHEREMLFLHHARLVGQRDAARDEERLRIIHAERLERLVLVEQFVVDLAERELDVETEFRDELVVGEKVARAGEEGGREIP